MKLSFSTLGCPDWSWSIVLSAAKDIGMDGVEVRCVGSELYAPHCAEFSEENAPATMERLAKLGLTIPVLDSNASIALAEGSAMAMREAREYIDLAARIGTPYVRVMCIPVPQPADADLELCSRQYAELCAYGESRGVTPLLETNGPLGDSSVMKSLMDGIPSANKGVLWDIHHPYRYFGESPATPY
ncbi:MAG: sugar phosphate isomerase/epimerase, partial [Ruminococcaceae bacterium]|nr:sugar phosphate isomerase/epimerase [Oscillospiraceae bacterium]